MIGGLGGLSRFTLFNLHIPEGLLFLILSSAWPHSRFSLGRIGRFLPDARVSGPVVHVLCSSFPVVINVTCTFEAVTMDMTASCAKVC